MKPFHSQRPHALPLLVEAHALRVETPNGRPLFMDLSLRMGREKAAVVGRNGVGKSTLLAVLARMLSLGRVEIQHEKVGVIHQNAVNWNSDESLLSQLASITDEISPESLIRRLTAHKFPPALAMRPMHTLSPGERTRAALICLFSRTPAAALLILDEPTFGLDFVGLSAMTSALRLWPGGLLVISHDREFLRDIGVEQEIRMGL